MYRFHQYILKIAVINGQKDDLLSNEDFSKYILISLFLQTEIRQYIAFVRTSNVIISPQCLIS